MSEPFYEGERDDNPMDDIRDWLKREMQKMLDMEIWRQGAECHRHEKGALPCRESQDMLSTWCILCGKDPLDMNVRLDEDVKAIKEAATWWARYYDMLARVPDAPHVHLVPQILPLHERLMEMDPKWKFEVPETLNQVENRERVRRAVRRLKDDPVLTWYNRVLYGDGVPGYNVANRGDIIKFNFPKEDMLFELEGDRFTRADGTVEIIDAKIRGYSVDHSWIDEVTYIAHDQESAIDKLRREMYNQHQAAVDGPIWEHRQPRKTSVGFVKRDGTVVKRTVNPKPLIDVSLNAGKDDCRCGHSRTDHGGATSATQSCYRDRCFCFRFSN